MKMRNKFVYTGVVLLALLVLGMVGCAPTPPERQAEKAFIKSFEKEYPEWVVTKIILTPCVAKNKYRGKFVCVARTPTSRCCAKVRDWLGYLPCKEYHSYGSEITWSVLVTYAHGDCYYQLANTVSGYE